MCICLYFVNKVDLAKSLFLSFILAFCEYVCFCLLFKIPFCEHFISEYVYYTVEATFSKRKFVFSYWKLTIFLAFGSVEVHWAKTPTLSRVEIFELFIWAETWHELSLPPPPSGLKQFCSSLIFIKRSPVIP